MLAYAMDVEIDDELAMVLPLPVPSRSADDAVAFLNLEGYERFFGDLAAAFPPEYVSGAIQRSSAPEAKPKLVVHDVGLFEASFVPTREDFVRLDVNASNAHDFAPEDERFRRWKATAATRLAALCRGMREGLRDLESARRSSWRLAPLTDELPPHFMNGNQLWTGTTFMDGSRARAGGRGRVRFSAWSERVPPQSVTLGFESLPDEALAQEITAELSRLVDRAAYGDSS